MTQSFSEQVEDPVEVSSSPPTVVAASPSREDDHRIQISVREVAVLRLALKGWGNKQIAKELCISDWTVKNHLTAVCKRLGVRNRTGAVAVVLRFGVLSLDEVEIDPQIVKHGITVGKTQYGFPASAMTQAPLKQEETGGSEACN